MEFPRFGLIRQVWPQHPEPNPEAWLAAELARTGLLEPVKKGDRVALTAGSRGIDSMPQVLTALVGQIKARGGEPFIYPAMGSHGGATAEGQVAVLAHLGITEETVGAPIYGGWEPVRIGTAAELAPVFVDQAALEADHVILVNRIKEHTDYIGATESGLLKVAVVGLGRQPGGESMHRLALNISYYRSIQAVAEVLFEKLKILGGVALLEDHHNNLRRLEVVPAVDLFAREPELLTESQAYKPQIPFEELDLLIIDEIGKEISGTGADTKVIGRIFNRFEQECEKPKIKRVIVLDLSEHTYGNAIGIGLADYTTRRAVDKIDYQALAINCITGSRPELGRVPLAFASAREAVETGLNTIGLWSPEGVKALWIANTKHVEWLAASSALIEAARGRPELEVHGELFDLPFDGRGDLPGLASLLPDR